MTLKRFKRSKSVRIDQKTISLSFFGIQWEYILSRFDIYFVSSEETFIASKG